MKTNFLHPSLEEDLVQGITEDIYSEWDTVGRRIAVIPGALFCVPQH